MPTPKFRKFGLTSPLVALGAGSTYLPEAQALFDRFTTPPDSARKALINDNFRALSLIRPKLDILWYIGADSQASRRNWSKDQYNLVAVGSPVFTADRGFQGDGVSARLATGFTPSTAVGAQHSLNSGSFGVWSRTIAASVNAGTPEAGCLLSGTNRTDLRTRNSSNNAFYGVNSAVAAVAVVDGSGQFTAVRRDASEQYLRRNNAQIGSNASASTSLPTVEFSFLGAGTASFSEKNLCMGFLGAGLTDGECDGLYEASLTYLTEIGAV